jgi:HAD superfamily hydrolase (TIGR01549 family)
MTRQFIFFDLGWTLEDETGAQKDRAHKASALLKEAGVNVSPGLILELQEKHAGLFAPSPFLSLLSSFGLSAETVRHINQESKWDKSLLSLYPDAIETIKTLKRDHFLGMIANQSAGTVKRLKEYKIDRYFDLILASDETGISKPDPAIFEIAEQRSNSKKENSWMVGDRLDNDIKPAREAGWHTVRVMRGYNIHQKPRTESEMPEYTINNLSELVGIIEKAQTPRIPA